MSQYENSSETKLTGEQSWIGHKSCAGGTLESIVDQATNHAQLVFAPEDGKGGMLEYEHYLAKEMATTAPMTHNNNQVDDIGVGLLPFVGINSFQTNGSTSVSATHGEYGGTSTMPSPKKTGDENGKRKLSIEKSSVSTKKAKTTAIHNQSERKRRDRISQRMKILQEMVPNCSSKTDRASMLDEVIKYLKQLQTQNRRMSTINMTSMMLPMMQQELQTFMMRMCMRMGMGVMDMNTINSPAVQPIIPSASSFMPNLRVNLDDCLPTPSTISVMSDPLVELLACQSQPITADTYSRLAAMLQQMQPPPTSKP